ncbi:hypothetical protein Agub_g4762, partial [Astrephomene gubernaculifera]
MEVSTIWTEPSVDSSPGDSLHPSLTSQSRLTRIGLRSSSAGTATISQQLAKVLAQQLLLPSTPACQQLLVSASHVSGAANEAELIPSFQSNGVHTPSGAGGALPSSRQCTAQPGSCTALPIGGSTRPIAVTATPAGDSRSPAGHQSAGGMQPASAGQRDLCSTLEAELVEIERRYISTRGGEDSTGGSRCLAPASTPVTGSSGGGGTSGPTALPSGLPATFTPPAAATVPGQSSQPGTPRHQPPAGRPQPPLAHLPEDSPWAQTSPALEPPHQSTSEAVPPVRSSSQGSAAGVEGGARMSTSQGSGGRCRSPVGLAVPVAGISLPAALGPLPPLVASPDSAMCCEGSTSVLNSGAVCASAGAAATGRAAAPAMAAWSVLPLPSNPAKEAPGPVCGAGGGSPGSGLQQCEAASLLDPTCGPCDAGASPGGLPTGMFGNGVVQDWAAPIGGTTAAAMQSACWRAALLALRSPPSARSPASAEQSSPGARGTGAQGSPLQRADNPEAALSAPARTPLEQLGAAVALVSSALATKSASPVRRLASARSLLPAFALQAVDASMHTPSSSSPPPPQQEPQHPGPQQLLRGASCSMQEAVAQVLASPGVSQGGAPPPPLHEPSSIKLSPSPSMLAAEMTTSELTVSDSLSQFASSGGAAEASSLPPPPAPYPPPPACYPRGQGLGISAGGSTSSGGG